jgi:hypothetical protein
MVVINGVMKQNKVILCVRIVLEEVINKENLVMGAGSQIKSAM